MALPSKALVTALLACVAVGVASDKTGSNQIVPGVDSKAPEKTNVGVKALALSAGLAGAVLAFGDVKGRNSVGRGLLYAAGLGALAGVGLVVQSQMSANKALASGVRV